MSEILCGSRTLPREIWKWHAWEVAAAIRKGEVSSREAVESCVQRIETVNPMINALSETYRELALSAAESADKLRATKAVMGPLHGVPITVKCNVDVCGHATTNGAVTRAAFTAPDNSPVVDNLLKGGAIIIGRSNAPAFSMRWFTNNALHGQTLNPWSERLSPGGSSGGAASAVASGMCSIAHGNDIGGSIRYPAYACGVFGMKPTAGRIPAYVPSAGDTRLFTSQQFAVQGPLTRCVRDLVLSFSVMASRDPRDPDWVPAVVGDSPSSGALKIGLVSDFGHLEIAPEVSNALRLAAEWLSDSGYIVETVELPTMADASQVWFTMVLTEIATGTKKLIEQSGDGDAIRSLEAMYRYAGAARSLDEYVRAFAVRTGLRRQWNEVFERYSALVMPTSLQLPFAAREDLDGDVAMARICQAQTPMLATSALNYPCVSVPVGLCGGSPVGVQIVGGAFQEDLCLRVAAAVESRAPRLSVF
ncbi:amidase (plasmid) [Burkholderia sp. SFA1]|nr:amidase [Burkholderia sp. SFA1]